ncbi:MAG TPA: signal peptidase I [bacterium]|nr:MAG: Signal peptidase IB [Parcubacteria group bacterium ADurb.Bin192]HPN14541.1 signal peptidase I [bacterium]
MSILERNKQKDDDISPSSSKAALKFFLELVQVVAISLAIIIPVRYFLVQPFFVKGASMEPNFFDHEYLIIDELSYRFREPDRGDIVVFHYPNDPKNYFIKRVIALPGETVEIIDGQVKVYNDQYPNGIVLDERAYLDDIYTAQTRRETLKANEYFVLGDNRASSLDSRYFGPISEDVVVGRVWVRGWPFDRWKIFSPPNYNF